MWSWFCIFTILWFVILCIFVFSLMWGSDQFWWSAILNMTRVMCNKALQQIQERRCKLCVVVLPSVCWAVYMWGSVFSCRGDYTGEEIIVTLVLPSLTGVIGNWRGYVVWGFRCRGDSQVGGDNYTLVLPSVSFIVHCVLCFQAWFMSGRFTGGRLFFQLSFSPL